MKMTGEQHIAVPREQVWHALNDPYVLRECIPGCQSLEKESDERLNAVVEIKIGPIGARMKGAVTLSELDPPNSYRITGEGQGGTVGFAKGAADVSLQDTEGGTLLRYDVDAQVGGRLAQLGGRVIDATAKQLATRFFSRFSEVVEMPTLKAPVEEAAAHSADIAPIASPDARVNSDSASARQSGLAVFGMVMALVGATLLGFLFGQSQPGTVAQEWIGLAIALLIIISSGAGFEFGRRSATPMLVLGPELIEFLKKGRVK